MVSVAVVQYAFKAGPASVKKKYLHPLTPLLLLTHFYLCRNCLCSLAANQMREWCWLKKDKPCSLINPNLISKPNHLHIFNMCNMLHVTCNMIRSPPSYVNARAKNRQREAMGSLQWAQRERGAAFFGGQLKESPNYSLCTCIHQSSLSLSLYSS